MTLHELRSALRTFPESFMITFSAGELVKILDEPGAEQAQVPLSDDLSPEQVGALPSIERSAATVRRWCGKGKFPGAYKDEAGHWRIPPESVGSYLRKRRERSSLELPKGASFTPEEWEERLTSSTGPDPDVTGPRFDDGDDDDPRPDLSSWRNHV